MGAETLGPLLISTIFTSRQQASEGRKMRGVMAKKPEVKPMPDIEGGKPRRRKEAARARSQRGGRASTILSGAKDTLG